ncbi:MAG TPA: hypothetical protein VIM56_12640 [Rhizomicrobium sp.]
MKIPYATSLSALMLLCSAHVALAEDAAPQNDAAKAEAAAPHWYDGVTGTKFTSVEGSTVQLSQNDDGLLLNVTAPNGSETGKQFRYLNDNLGGIFDAADTNAAIGVFRQSAKGIEAEYADGHNEVLSANAGGGLTIALTAPDARQMCMKWYPQGHVFAESERKEALAAYASKLGLASDQKDATASNCTAAAVKVASVPAPSAPAAAKPVKLASAHAPKILAAPKAVLVRASDVHVIDADAMPKGVAPVPPEIAAGALATAPAAAVHAIPATAKETVPSSRGASDCLHVDSDGQNWGFRNSCDNSVQFAYCLQNGKDASTACGSGTAVGGVAKNGFFALIASSAVIDDNHQFRWVACSGDAGTVSPHLDRSDPPAGRCVRSQDS